MNIGELFILGFRGMEIPDWLIEFEKNFGLGGIILFDYNCQTKTYENNIESPEQVKELCKKISNLPSRPLIFVDQEGGKVRRLKEKKGFAPLPSALQMNLLSIDKRLSLLQKSFGELKKLGIDYNLAPVVDLNYNPKNPDIGAVERSFSDVASEVEENARLVMQAAIEVNLGLCLKHFPGLGGATVNSHHDLTDLSDTVSETQLKLFWELGKDIPALIVSHGIVKQWDPELPTSMSKYALTLLREKLPESLLISDDMQMQGLQKKLSTREACLKGLTEGLDMVIIGNNLLADDASVLKVAKELMVHEDKLAPSIDRVLSRKRQYKQ